MDQTITIGTVIHGTLRDEDLLPAFADELKRVRQTSEDHAILIDDARDPELFTTDTYTAADIVHDLIDALQEYAPSHMYFGAIEGDGADFGWWTTDPRDTCDVVDIMGGNGAYVDTECGLYVQVSDHGNISVYELAGAEIWSAV
jgi:hypothetical protein